MMTWIEHLKSPWVLAGFGVFILWLVLKYLLFSEAKNLPPEATERLISRGMYYLFILAVLLIVVGFIRSWQTDSLSQVVTPYPSDEISIKKTNDSYFIMVRSTRKRIFSTRRETNSLLSSESFGFLSFSTTTLVDIGCY